MGLGGLARGGSYTTERLTAAASAFQPKIADNVSKRKPLLDLFEGQVKTYSGGTEIAVRIRYRRSAKLGQAGGTGVWSYYDELSTSPTDTVKAMGERYSNFNQPIAISHEELWENSGPEQEYDRWKENTEFAMDDLSDDLNEVHWGISGGDGNKLPTPLTDIISGTDTLTLYGLSKGTGATDSWLNSQEVNDIGDLETYLLDKMRGMELEVIDNAPNKSDKVDFWMTHKYVFLGLENILPQYVQVGKTADADLGFDKIYLNRVPIMWDSECPLDVDQRYQIFGGVKKYFEVGVRKQSNFRMTKFVNMEPKQFANVAQLHHSYAFVCNNPRTTVRGKGIDL